MQQPHALAEEAWSCPLGVVLDTQAVLDWRLFSNAHCSSWARDLSTGKWAWHATLEMRAELSFVLSRPFVSRWPASPEGVMAWFDQHAALTLPPPGAQSLKCSDRSDQKFIDLAVHLRADWLISRDRAVLKLARPALQLHGLRIVTPEAWSHASRCSHSP